MGGAPFLRIPIFLRIIFLCTLSFCTRALSARSLFAHITCPGYTNRRCPSLSGRSTGEVYTVVNSPYGELALDLCVLCSDGHVIVRDGQETCVEDGLNGLTINGFNEQLAVLCQ